MTQPKASPPVPSDPAKPASDRLQPNTETGSARGPHGDPARPKTEAAPSPRRTASEHPTETPASAPATSATGQGARPGQTAHPRPKAKPPARAVPDAQAGPKAAPSRNPQQPAPPEPGAARTQREPAPQSAPGAGKPERPAPSPPARAQKPAPPSSPAGRARAPAQAAAAPATPNPKQPAHAAAAARKAAPAPVQPPALPARGGRRHVILALSFVVMVLIPMGISAAYLWTRAVDQYASYVGFSVRTEEVGSAIELLGGVTELSGSSSSDTDILYKFLQSQELVSNVDRDLDLRQIWSRADPEVDPVFAYDPPGTIEDLVAHWERKVAIYYDSGTGLLDLRVLAFDPNEAQAVAQAIFAKSSAMINELSTLAREDAIGYARDELDQAVTRLREARVALNAFRNRTQIVDPTIDTQGQMGLVTNLQAQLADALIEVDLLRETTRAGDPRITQGELRIQVIERRIEEERRKMGLGGGSSGERSVFADLVGEYETLAVDLEFAQQSYVAALAAFDGARNEARRQSRYLAAHVRPTLAERAEYPERGFLLGLIALFSFLAWSIAALVAYSLRGTKKKKKKKKKK